MEKILKFSGYTLCFSSFGGIKMFFSLVLPQLMSLDMVYVVDYVPPEYVFVSEM